jgi:secretion/DNA translocation related TadE-like protein
VGSAVLARHRAQAAADLAVLAAAARVPAGAQVACAAAQAITTAMQATLRACDVSDLDVTVAVTAGTGLRIGPQAQATARAGPIRPG